MKVVVAIPAMLSFEIGRISLYQWDRTASPEVHFLLIDNSPEPTPYAQLFERGFLDAQRWTHVRNHENIGLIRSSQQAYNFALQMDADILVLTHNDVWVYPEPAVAVDDEYVHWDEYLASEFETLRSGKQPLGVVGLFGSKGCSSSGHRLDTFGSLIEIQGHGRQMTDWMEPAVCLDGFFLACSMKMLREAKYVHDGGGPDHTSPLTGVSVQQGGFDQRYQWHHVYDYDISLTSIELGYRNAVVNIPCHHLSGLTANNAAYATSGQDVHQANYDRWLAKWSAKLDVMVDAQWNYKWSGK